MIAFLFFLLMLAVPVQAANLLQFSDLTYLGAFRVPTTGADDQHSFRYSNGPIAFNPAVPSLFMACFGSQTITNVGEMTIPTPVISATSTLSDLPTATIRQTCQDIQNGVSSPLRFAQGGVGGLLVSGSTLYFTVFDGYPAGGFVGGAHFKKNSLNLATADASGPFTVTNTAFASESYTNGPMAWIPSEWVTPLGGKPAITYQCCTSIIGQTSWGPSAFGFDPAALGATAIPSVAMQWYDTNHPTLGQWNGGPLNYPPYWNNAGGVTYTMRGLVLVPGTRSALYFTSQGQTYCYGEGTNDASLGGQPVPGEPGVIYCYDPAYNYKGDHGYPYRAQILAFDLNDWAAVVAGTKAPYQAVPYAVWPLTPTQNIPFTTGTGDSSGGVTYDPATRRIYWSQTYVDDAKPIVHVFQVPATGSTTATLTITKAGSGSGQVTATGIDCGTDCTETYTQGTVVTLTANPNTGSAFSGWSGATDCSDGVITVSADMTCTANFSTTAGQSTLGLTTIGSLQDTGNSNTIDGTKVATGTSSLVVSEIHVYIGNIDAAPNNQFQVAIYNDSAGKPSTLVASSTSATLLPNSWNVRPLTATLNPSTNYWLMYNSNGTTANVNSMKYNANGNSTYITPVTFGSWPTSLAGTTATNATYSIYAVVAPPPPPSVINPGNVCRRVN